MRGLGATSFPVFECARIAEMIHQRMVTTALPTRGIT